MELTSILSFCTSSAMITTPVMVIDLPLREFSFFFNNLFDTILYTSIESFCWGRDLRTLRKLQDSPRMNWKRSDLDLTFCRRNRPSWPILRLRVMLRRYARPSRVIYLALPWIGWSPYETASAVFQNVPRYVCGWLVLLAQYCKQFSRVRTMQVKAGHQPCEHCNAERLHPNFLRWCLPIWSAVWTAKVGSK